MSEKSKLTQPPTSSAAEALEAARRARRSLASTRATLEAAIKSLESDNEALRNQVEALVGLADVAAEAKPIRAEKPAGKGKPEACYIMMASDWHLAARVRKSMVAGANEYNPSIAEQRVNRFAVNNLKVLNVLRGTWDVKRAILWIGGDIMEGWIHPGEGMPENFMSPSEEMYFAFEQLTSVIQYILAEYGVDQLRVVMSAGNHGRSTVKKQSNDFRTSYEYLMYRFIRHSLRNESRVECVLSEGYETFEDVYGLRIAFHHGDKVKYGGGVGGIYPSLYRRIHRISDGAFHRNLDVLGHHHQLSFGQGAFVNGSLIGLTAYAAGEGFRPEPPQQGSFLVDAKHKVPVAQFPIFVGEK